MSEAATHLRELAERIGPRPTTTDTEAEAADYIVGRFESRGLEVERQEFNAPRTYAWAFVVYHTLTIGAAVLTGFYALPALALALLAAVVMKLDLDTRWGLSNLMPKGPTQNIIARKPSNARRGERVQRVLIVAHYDSARTSLAFHPSMVKNFGATFGLMKALTWLVVVFAALMAWNPGFIADLAPWPWYATMAVSAYLLVPLLINVHREIAMPFSDGANDNASGVAAMLGVLERACPEEVVTAETASMRAVRQSESEDWDEGVDWDAAGGWDGQTADIDADTQPHEVLVAEEPGPAVEPSIVESDEMPADGVLQYAPAGPLDDSFADAFGTGDLGGPVRADDGFADDTGWEARGVHEDQGSMTMDEPAPEPPPIGRSVFDDPDVVEADEPDEGPAGETPKRRFFGRKRRKQEEEDWLGVGDDFDVHSEGQRIGSWDQFDDQDERGSKGGEAGWAIEDPAFASSEAARIRHLVTHSVDRGLAEKEIWFIATGAEETGTWGMRALLDTYGDDLKKSAIINIDNVGAGTVAWVTKEGMSRRFESDRRLMSAARRVARENDWRIKGIVYKGLSTDATPALARGFRAMSVMAFDINGRLPNWHWKTDTVENVSVENVELAADFVSAIAKEL